MASAAGADFSPARPRIFSADDPLGDADAVRVQRHSGSVGKHRTTPDVRNTGLVDGFGYDRVNLDHLSNKVLLGSRTSASNVAVAPLPTPLRVTAGKALSPPHTELTRSKSLYNPPVKAVAGDIPHTKPRNPTLPRMAIDDDHIDSGSNRMDSKAMRMPAFLTVDSRSSIHLPDGAGFPLLPHISFTLQLTPAIKLSSSSKQPATRASALSRTSLPSGPDPRDLEFLLSTQLNLDIRNHSPATLSVACAKSSNPLMFSKTATAAVGIRCSDTHLRTFPDLHMSPPLHISTGTYTRIRPCGPRHTTPVEPQSLDWTYLYGSVNCGDVSMWQSADGGFMRGMRSRNLQVDSRTGRFSFVNDRGSLAWAASCFGVDTHCFENDVQWLSWKGSDPASRQQLHVVGEEGLFQFGNFSVDIDQAITANRSGVISGNGRSMKSSTNSAKISTNSRVAAINSDSDNTDEEVIRANVLLDSIFQASSIFAVNESELSFTLSTITPRPGTYFDPIKSLPYIACKRSFTPIAGIASTLPLQPSDARLQHSIHSYRCDRGAVRCAAVSSMHRSSSFAESVHAGDNVVPHRRHSSMADARMRLGGLETTAPAGTVPAAGGGRPTTLPTAAAGGAGAIGAWMPRQLARRMSRGCMAEPKSNGGSSAADADAAGATPRASCKPQFMLAAEAGARWRVGGLGVVRTALPAPSRDSPASDLGVSGVLGAGGSGMTRRKRRASDGGIGGGVSELLADKAIAAASRLHQRQLTRRAFSVFLDRRAGRNELEALSAGSVGRGTLPAPCLDLPGDGSDGDFSASLFTDGDFEV
ncbi:hypothetical protein HDU84_003782 [Entophlyctis sp. JEL0112]|nr:hypothetical protein HDU84_003782 [Entophlyctis sp. JEL0112]